MYSNVHVSEWVVACKTSLQSDGWECNSEVTVHIEQWREYLLILRREEYSAMTARTLLHFCEPLVLRGFLAAAGISVSRPLLSKDSEVVEVALSPGASFSKDPPWLEKVPRRYSSENLRRRQNPDGLPLSLSFSPSRLAPFARFRGNSSLSFVLPSYFSSLSSHLFFLPSHFSFLSISLHFFSLVPHLSLSFPFFACFFVSPPLFSVTFQQSHKLSLSLA